MRKTRKQLELEILNEINNQLDEAGVFAGEYGKGYTDGLEVMAEAIKGIIDTGKE